MQFTATILLLVLPWLNPFSPGPTPSVPTWLFGWGCAAALLLIQALSSMQRPARTAASGAWGIHVPKAWLLAALLSVAIALLQYFGVSEHFSPWVNTTRAGEAFANLRQRNQFATLANIGLAALLWGVANARLPRLHLAAALVAAILGLALNYSAYESEIYRAGLKAVPLGQFEAALSLGLTKWQALRHVLVPQAVRIVMPPVTSDFIALFKDTSVCSAITVIELTKRYSVLALSTGRIVELALVTAVLYLAMSWPLSLLSRWFEARLERSAGPTQ